MSNFPIGAKNDPDATFNQPDDDGTRICRECQEEIENSTVDEIGSCSDHLDHEELKEAYYLLRSRYLLAQNEVYRLRNLIKEYTERLSSMIIDYRRK